MPVNAKRHKELVGKSKVDKYVRKYGSWRQLRLKLIRKFGGNLKSRGRSLERLLTQILFKTREEYINYKVFGDTEELKNE